MAALWLQLGRTQGMGLGAFACSNLVEQKGIALDPDDFWKDQESKTVLLGVWGGKVAWDCSQSNHRLLDMLRVGEEGP